MKAELGNFVIVVSVDTPGNVFQPKPDSRFYAEDSFMGIPNDKVDEFNQHCILERGAEGVEEGPYWDSYEFTFDGSSITKPKAKAAALACIEEYMQEVTKDLVDEQRENARE